MPRRGKNITLTMLSYIFYGWSNPLFTVLMFGSTLVDYWCGLIIGTAKEEQKGYRKAALIISICFNLGLLCFFKYTGFALESYNQLFEFFGLTNINPAPVLNFLLPLGISFYTFQSMSYTIDVYRKEAKPVHSFTDFACFVSMFPQLVAGPIIRFQEVANQLADRIHSREKFARGVVFFSLGMAKKVLVANPCGKVADTAFAAGSLPWIDSWIGVLAYSFQIYFDFSGYSDMAIGLGLMFGFVFPKNFDSPYRSTSITEFWNRWHISLSTWLKQYLYIPLGGNRKGTVRTAINLAIVMLLGGLWHGAAWTFIAWGAYHGLLLGSERLLGKKTIYQKLPGPLKVILTFILVLIGWVFFRAETFPLAIEYFKSMFVLSSYPETSLLIKTIIYSPYYVMMMVVAAIITWVMPQTWDWSRSITPAKAVITFLLFILSIAMLSVQSYNPFIYFNF